MSKDADHKTPARSNRLVDAVREVRIAQAERSDVVVDLKEADRARLEILAGELAPVFDEVPLDDERFDFAISSGLQPRLWIDATAHVIMGRDRRTYRFVRDSRLGRIVLAESNQTEPVVAAVTRYIAERLHERELAFAGDEIISYRQPVKETPMPPAAGLAELPARTDGLAGKGEPATVPAAPKRTGSTAMGTAGWLLLGLIVGAGLLILYFRDVLVS